MKRIKSFINDKLTNFLVNQTYKREISKAGSHNQFQRDILFQNEGIDI